MNFHLPFSLDLYVQASEKTKCTCSHCRYWDPNRYECVSKECIEGSEEDE